MHASNVCARFTYICVCICISMCTYAYSVSRSPDGKDADVHRHNKSCRAMPQQILKYCRLIMLYFLAGYQERLALS